MESRAATARISAQETTFPKQAVFTADLIASITSNPRTDMLLAFAVFSPIMSSVSSSRIEPSQP
jgi:hypothetical protein